MWNLRTFKWLPFVQIFVRLQKCVHTGGKSRTKLYCRPAHWVDCATVFCFLFCQIKLSSWREARVYCLAVASHLAWVAIGTQMLFRHCLLARVPVFDGLSDCFLYKMGTIRYSAEIIRPLSVLLQQKGIFLHHDYIIQLCHSIRPPHMFT